MLVTSSQSRFRKARLSAPSKMRSRTKRAMLSLSKIFSDPPEDEHLHIVVQATPAGELDIVSIGIHFQFSYFVTPAAGSSMFKSANSHAHLWRPGGTSHYLSTPFSKRIAFGTQEAQRDTELTNFHISEGFLLQSPPLCRGYNTYHAPSSDIQRIQSGLRSSSIN